MRPAVRLVLFVAIGCGDHGTAVTNRLSRIIEQESREICACKTGRCIIQAKDAAARAIHAVSVELGEQALRDAWDYAPLRRENSRLTRVSDLCVAKL